MRKTIITVFTIGSIAISAITVSAVSAATDIPVTSTTIIQRQLNRQDRKNARLNEFAQILGITTNQLQTELKSGKQPLQIAHENGLSHEQLKQKMVNHHQKTLSDIKQQLTVQVQSGQITQTQMDAKLKLFSSHGQKHQGLHRRHFGF